MQLGNLDLTLELFNILDQMSVFGITLCKSVNIILSTNIFSKEDQTIFYSIKMKQKNMNLSLRKFLWILVTLN